MENEKEKARGAPSLKSRMDEIQNHDLEEQKPFKNKQLKGDHGYTYQHKELRHAYR